MVNAQASILHYAKGITEAAAEGAQVKDCVITVPAFFGPTQRQAVIDAASLAGLLVTPPNIIHLCKIAYFSHIRHVCSRPSLCGTITSDIICICWLDHRPQAFLASPVHLGARMTELFHNTCKIVHERSEENCSLQTLA
jgi:hypothetical protein